MTTPVSSPAAVEALQALIATWRAKAAQVDTYHATMGTGWKACADDLQACVQALAAGRSHPQQTQEAARLDAIITAFEALQDRGYFLHDALGPLSRQGFIDAMVIAGNAVLAAPADGGHVDKPTASGVPTPTYTYSSEPFDPHNNVVSIENADGGVRQPELLHESHSPDDDGQGVSRPSVLETDATFPPLNGGRTGGGESAGVVSRLHGSASAHRIAGSEPADSQPLCNAFESHPICILLCARCWHHVDEHVRAAASSNGRTP